MRDPTTGGRYTVDQKGAIVPALPAGVTQAQIDASIAANPQASKGGYEGSTPMPTTEEIVAAANGGNGGGAQAPATTDYSSFLGIYGLPSDVQAKINQIFAQSTDVNQATALAMAYIRGTTWYAQTYPGIQEGIARGVVSNEADYRNYLNNVNNLTKQYYNRDVSGAEIAGYLKSGYDASYVGKIYGGDAFVNANRNNIQYLSGAFGDTGQLTGDELTALGRENSGIDTALGQKLQNALQITQQRFQKVFQGQLATPSLSLTNGRLSAPGLGGASTSDVGA